jgi:TPP-dependent pyruvate/acetoin dehydrogenase alpha subunit
MAAIWKLPVLFVCENNLYAMFTHISKTSPTKTIAQRAKAYGIKGITIDGMSAINVYTETGKIIEEMRNGSGPVLLECLTYRYGGHSKSDPRIYRTKEEEKSWKERDPIKQMQKYFIENNIYSVNEIKSIDKKKKSEISTIYEKVLNSPYPDLESAEEDVYV